MKTSFNLFITAFLFLSAPSYAQNLVENGNFESYTPAESGVVLIEEILDDWYGYFTTPDYFNTEMWSPEGVLDYCGILPHSGYGMAGGYQLGYFPGMNAYNREFLQGKLREPLKAGRSYYIEMYVAPMLKSPVINFAIKNIGIALTDTHYTNYELLDRMLMPEIPDLENSTGILGNLSNWTKISGCITANGNETTIIIGNFRQDEQTDTAQLTGAWGEKTYNYRMSYYLFDDILVREIPVPYIIPGEARICPDSAIVLTAMPEGALYQWQDGSAGQHFTADSAGTYSVALTTAEGCQLSASAVVTYKYCGPGCAPMMIPNVFSPNNDGVNDFFYPKHGGDIYQINWSVFNRWGQRVFYCVSSDGKWDGTYMGKPCDAGSYFYMLEYTDCQSVSRQHKGDISLIK